MICCECLAIGAGPSYIIAMNRRDFTRGLLSLGLTPSVPAKAIGAGAAATTGTGAAQHMYFLSYYTARQSATTSARALARELNMDAQTARDVFARLVRDNTVSPPDAFGVSTTLNPLRAPVAPAISPAPHAPKTGPQTSEAKIISQPERDVSHAVDHGDCDAPMGDVEIEPQEVPTDAQFDAAEKETPQMCHPDRAPLDIDETEMDSDGLLPEGLPQS